MSVNLQTAAAIIFVVSDRYDDGWPRYHHAVGFCTRGVKTGLLQRYVCWTISVNSSYITANPERDSTSCLGLGYSTPARPHQPNT